MDKPKLSIIIPVYNAEAYLPRCLDSLLCQNEQDFEILLINDGSSDNSGNICDEYTQKDSRIKVIHKDNGGVSSARNLGLEKATGEWVAFVDSDDEVTQDYLTIPPKYKNSDVIQKGCITMYLDGHFENHPQSDNLIEGQEDVYRFFIQRRNMALWDKLIKRNIIANDRFCTNIPIGEDGLFFFTIINKIKYWGFSECGQYVYNVRSGTAMGKFNITQRLDIRLESCLSALEIAQKKKNKILFDNFFADQYLPPLWRRRNYFTAEQKELYLKLLHYIRYNNLKYLSWKHFIKYSFIAIRSFIKYRR